MWKQCKKIILWILAASIIVTVGIVLIISIRTGNGDQIQLVLQENAHLTEGWNTLGHEMTDKGEGYFYRTLPDHIETDSVLVFRNFYQKVRVKVDGEEIFQYGLEADDDYFIAANVKCYVKLRPAYAGKQIEIYIKNDSGRQGVKFSGAVLSTTGAVVTDILRSNLGAGIFCVISSVIALVLLLLMVLLLNKMRARDLEVFGALGLFMLLASVWVFTDSNLMQIFTGNSQLVLLVSFEAFLLMPVPLLRFVDLISQYDKKILRCLQCAFVLNCLVQNLIYICKLGNFIDMLMVTHLLLIGSIIYLIYYVIKEKISYHSHYATGILAGICIFTCVGGMSLVSFYRSRGIDNERFFVLGFFLFMLDLIFLSVEKVQELTESGAKAKILEELAYHDMLTGFGNRVLYEQWLDGYEAMGGKDEGITVAVMDINGLKYVNDHYGHAEGDRLIQDTAKCIEDVFQKIGQCFRTGGDEFVVFVPGKVVDADECRERLRERTDLSSHARKIPLSVSSGFASGSPGSGRTDLSELIKMADRDMYRNKKEFYKSADEGRDSEGEAGHV